MTKKEAVLVILALAGSGVKVHLTPEGIDFLKKHTKEASSVD